MIMFQNRSFWDGMKIPRKELKNRFEYFFGKDSRKIEDRNEALGILINITSTIQNEMVNRLKTENTYRILLKLYFIFDEVHSIYLKEKEARTKLVEVNISGEDIVDVFENNRNIERNIIDACNIWIENCVLYQHDLDLKKLNVKKEFVMDYTLIIDMYLYGFASRAISLLILSKSIGEENTFYGLEITHSKDIPAEVLKYHPYIYFNTAILGNQNILVDIPLTQEANDTDFGKGFFQETNVQFLLFLATIKNFHDDQLRGDDKSLTVISKDTFVSLVESYTNPRIEDGEAFYESFVLTKDKLKQHLRKKEEIIWLIGTNKYRHELRPFIGLNDGNVLIAYGALEQAKQLWISYFSNGGMCYTNPNKSDYLTKAMEKRNKELSDILVERAREILNKYYTPKIDYKDVQYYRIFGEREINYGDYDIVYFDESAKELFLIESKYFSDSLNSSGMVTDYNKMFSEDGYYNHCRRRYDLVLAEPEKLKNYIGTEEEISVHMLFLSSKPIEMEFQDKDGTVTFLSLGIFEKYITGNLISGETDDVMRPIKKF
ncbi:hypothetical protein [Clostridium magnum]|uniref:hypothetical protein n=1 Tax=Clostridium magnum TaxID=33954 RepID=UPI000911DF1F|nr:hypothetical protein [Clostridium magnum]SHH77232.1 hypothetical protein SAMN02745944_01403 [Clostridium magnum DSM 2767]